MKKHYTVKEAARILGVSTNTLYKYLNEGKLRGKRIGRGRFKITHSELFPYVSEPATFSKSSPNLKEALELFKGKSYRKNDFVFFELFLAIVFLGNGLLTLFYRLSLFTPASSLIFLLIPLFSLVPGVLFFLETFWLRFEKYHPLTHILAIIVSGYSAYFSFSFGGYEVSSIFIAILIVLVIEAFRGMTKLHEKCFFEREFLSFLFIATTVWGILVLFKAEAFPIFVLRDFIAQNHALFIFLWLLIVEFPLIILFIPKFKTSNIEFFILPFLALTSIIAAIFMSSEGKWIASFYTYIIALFEFFLLWWKKQEEDISAKLAPFVTLDIIWMLFVVFAGVFGIGLSQRSIIDSKTELIKTRLSQMSGEINFVLDTVDRRLTSASQKLEIGEAILSRSEDEATSKSKAIFDGIPTIRRVVIYNANGRVLGEYPRDPKLQGAELGSRDYFQAVKTTKETYTSDIFTAITSTPVVVRIYPILRGGEFIGAIAVVPDLQELSRKFNSSDQNVLYYGYDRKGNYVLHPNTSELGKSVAQDIVGESKQGVYRDIYIFRVFERIDSLGWTLFAQGSVILLLRDFLGLNIMVGILILVGASFSFGAILLAKRWIKT